MSLVFKSTTQITFDDLSPERLDSYGITIVTGDEAAPVLYLCADGTAVRVCPDDNGYCDFAVPENAAFPFSMFEGLRHEYNCDLVRVVDDRGHVVTSLSKRGVIDVLGHDHQGPGDRIISCINGNAPDPEPDSVLNMKVKIGRELVSRNPRLLKDPPTLLLLVEDIHEQRHPPFKAILRKKSPKDARLYADAMLAWANESYQPS